MEVEIIVLVRSGEDLYIKVPKGTVIKDAISNKVIADLSQDKQRELVLSGGRGGKGNSHFATSTRHVPRFAQDGEKGIEKEHRCTFIVLQRCFLQIIKNLLG